MVCRHGLSDRIVRCESNIDIGLSDQMFRVRWYINIEILNQIVRCKMVSRYWITESDS